MLLFAKWRGGQLWTIATIISCFGILVSSVIYFTGSLPGRPGGETPRFLLEKGDWALQPWWLSTFYFHVIGASVCLIVGMPLMFPAWTARHPQWHRWLGYVYVNAVLWMAAPSGLVLSFTAKGGLLGTLGFGLAGLLWWYTTWSGYRAIRRGELITHIRAMIRSYSLALSAPAFRIIQIALYFGGLPDDVNYVASLWLSIAVSACLAESCLVGQAWNVPSISRGVLS
jgi:uncharacterized membrane protein